METTIEVAALISGRPYASLRNPLTRVGALLDAGALQPSRTGRNHLLWLAHSQDLLASASGERVLLRTRVVALMAGNSIPFAEVTTHRATLEEASMELTRDAVEYRAEPAGEATR